MNEQTIWPELPYWPHAMVAGFLVAIVIGVIIFLTTNNSDIGQ